MKPQEAVRLCKKLFEAEPVISRVEAEFRPEDREDYAIDLTLVVEGDLYEAETRVIPLVIRLMDSLPDTPIEFVIVPNAANPESHGTLIYSRMPPESA